MLIFFHSEHVRASREIAATNPAVDQVMTDSDREAMALYGVHAFPAFVRVEGETHTTVCDLTPDEAVTALVSFDSLVVARQAAAEALAAELEAIRLAQLAEAEEQNEPG